MLYVRGASLSLECTDEASSFSGAAWSSPNTVVSPKRTRRAALLAVGDPVVPDPDAGDPLVCLVLSALLRLLLLGMGATAAAPALDDDRRSTILATAASPEQQHRYAHVAIQNAHGSATRASPAAGSHCGTSDGGSVT